MGFYYLGLATDQQQNAYILKPGETEAPAGLMAALAAGNRLQDILMRAMVVGHTGNTVLREALADARDAGLEPSIYTHPLGYHGHAAGPTIGLWDRQDGVPGNGDYPLYDRPATQSNSTSATRCRNGAGRRSASPSKRMLSSPAAPSPGSPVARRSCT